MRRLRLLPGREIAEALAIVAAADALAAARAMSQRAAVRGCLEELERLRAAVAELVTGEAGEGA